MNNFFTPQRLELWNKLELESGLQSCLEQIALYDFRTTKKRHRYSYTDSLGNVYSFGYTVKVSSFASFQPVVYLSLNGSSVWQYGCDDANRDEIRNVAQAFVLIDAQLYDNEQFNTDLLINTHKAYVKTVKS